MRAAIALFVTLCLFGLAGCASAGAPEAERARVVAQRYGLTLGAPSPSTVTTLPDRLSPNGDGGFNSEFVWALIQDSASADGYDLKPYLGQQVTQRSYRLKERYRGEPASLETVEVNSRLIAAWVAVETMSPGPISLSEMQQAQK